MRELSELSEAASSVMKQANIAQFTSTFPILSLRGLEEAPGLPRELYQGTETLGPLEQK